jgi:hypothetical protein
MKKTTFFSGFIMSFLLISCVTEMKKEITVGNYTTKYFGEIIIDENNRFEDIFFEYNGVIIKIYFCDFYIHDYNEHIKTCFGFIDKYFEINEMAKNKIIENFPKDKQVEFYFKSFFDELEMSNEELKYLFDIDKYSDFDIKRTVENLNYPYFLFEIFDNELYLSVGYTVSEELSDHDLQVMFNKNLELSDFRIDG